jgi:rfaE bifunctional protein nucleotidyltransferase chain/domain
MAPISLLDLLALRASWRGVRRMVLTNGVFDLFHAGHAAYLAEARAHGDLLVVALNSDASVRALKGPLRPLVPEDDRAAVLLALRCVDYVTIFAEPTAEHVVAALQPDLYVKGADYALDDGSQRPDLQRLPEAQLVLAYGGEVQLLPYLAGRSTSELVRLVVERYG